MKLQVGLASLMLLSSFTPLLAQEDDPCASSKSLEDYVLQLTEQVSASVNRSVEVATSEALEKTQTEVAGRANADGLTGGRLDLLRKLFLALDLGQIEEKDEQLIFNFNPDNINFDTLGQFSPRLIVHKPVLFVPLEEQIDALPEDEGKPIKGALSKELTDLDDVEVRIRWERASDAPRGLIQDLASAIFEPAYSLAAEATMLELGEESAAAQRSIRMELNNVRSPEPAKDSRATSTGATLVSDLCAVPQARAIFLHLVRDLTEKGTSALTDLRQSLTEEQFFALADLIDGEPLFSVETAYRRRDHATGPDERSINLHYEIGNISYAGFTRWRQRRGKDPGVANVQAYLKEKGHKSIPKFSLTLDYSTESEFRLDFNDDSPEFIHADSRRLSVTGNAGWYLGNSRDRRVELEATYEDVTDDPTRQSRFVGTLSWVEKLNGDLAKVVGGSELVVTLIYADKSEFRGEVDKALGARAGLKWSFDR
jgi:hypothetical protein